MSALSLGSGHVVEVDRPGEPPGLISMAGGSLYYLTNYHFTVNRLKEMVSVALMGCEI